MATEPCGPWARDCCSRSFREDVSAAISRRCKARFDAAVAEYQKAALNGYREVANTLITIQKLAEVRGHQQIGVTALQDASDLARARTIRASPVISKS